MKVLSRLASPAGFALVLLLFFLLPFLSVSCEVPGMGTAGVSYSGTNLVAGSDPSPEVPDQLKELIDSLPGGGESQSPAEEPPDADVQVLAIIMVVLAVAGIATVLVSRLRARLFGAAGVALATLAMAIVTLVVARSNLEDVLLADAEDSGVSGDVAGLPDIGSSIADLINTEAGFWLVVVLLALIAVLNAGAALFGGRLSAAGVGATPPSGFPFAGESRVGPPTVDPLTGQPSVAERPTDPGVGPTAAAPGTAAPATWSPAEPTAQPPATEPPTASPAEPTARPAAAKPPATGSPAEGATQPPTAEPPATEPAGTAPPTTPPAEPVAQPPAAGPPPAESPAPQPPSSEPPASGAPPADPPTKPA